MNEQDKLKQALKDYLKLMIDNKMGSMKIIKASEVLIDEVAFINELKVIYFNEYKIVL